MLIKYKDTDDYSESGFIVASMHDNPSEILKVIKEADSINLNDKLYKYSDNEFVPSTSDGMLDVIYVYVEGLDY